MIVDKRKRIRTTNPDKHDWTAEFNFYEPGNWDDQPYFENDVIPWQIVLGFALLTGFSAYMIGCYLF
jgi:hypothetical protein